MVALLRPGLIGSVTFSAAAGAMPGSLQLVTGDGLSWPRRQHLVVVAGGAAFDHEPTRPAQDTAIPARPQTAFRAACGRHRGDGRYWRTRWFAARACPGLGGCCQASTRRSAPSFPGTASGPSGRRGGRRQADPALPPARQKGASRRHRQQSARPAAAVLGATGRTDVSGARVSHGRRPGTVRRSC